MNHFHLLSPIAVVSLLLLSGCAGYSYPQQYGGVIARPYGIPYPGVAAPFGNLNYRPYAIVPQAGFGRGGDERYEHEWREHQGYGEFRRYDRD
jgi:hypothetical protein